MPHRGFEQKSFS